MRCQGVGDYQWTLLERIGFPGRYQSCHSSGVDVSTTPGTKGILSTANVFSDLWHVVRSNDNIGLVD